MMMMDRITQGARRRWALAGGIFSAGWLMLAAAAEGEGNTKLHRAAYDHDVAAIQALLAAGDDANTPNDAGATPLLYGAGDPVVVKLLLDAGANPNLASKSGRTPLHAAVMQRAAAETSRLLLAAGAQPRALNRHGAETLLETAIFGGDATAVQRLLDAGAAVNTTSRSSPLTMAAWLGEASIVDLLLTRGAEINHAPDFAGHAANFALYGGHPELAMELFRRGADPRAPSIWGHRTPPIMWAAYNHQGDARVARWLVEQGIDVNAANEEGQTALSFALKTGPHTELVEYLRSVGATEPVQRRTKRTPQRVVPADPAAHAAAIREQVQRAVNRLQRSSRAFIQNPFVRDQAKCVSCHGQYLPAPAYALARERGLTVDDHELGRQLEAHLAMLNATAESARQMDEPVPDAPMSLGNGSLALRALHFAPDATTDALSTYLMRVQRADGSWLSFDRRPPMEDGPLVGTAWAALAVRDYPPANRAAEAAECLNRARTWLAAQSATTPNEAVFQLLGLAWTGAVPAELSARAQRIISEQQPDGGWAQLPGRETDAWATGTALYALHAGAGMACTDPVYQRGVNFLLRTQFDDGTWWVRNRTWPFQPHFNGQFAHGKDQRISQAGTAWAAIALLLTLDPSPTVAAPPSGQELIATFVASREAPLPSESVREALASTVDFKRDIEPVFERSCTGCHGGDRPKAKFSLRSREGLIKGGQSGESPVSLGYGEESPLLHYIAGEVEDLEMPPLDRREKYPPVTPEERELIRAWIDAGAVWPETTAEPLPDNRVVTTP